MLKVYSLQNEEQLGNINLHIHKVSFLESLESHLLVLLHNAVVYYEVSKR